MLPNPKPHFDDNGCSGTFYLSSLTNTFSILTVNTLLLDIVTIKKGEANTLLEKLTEFGVLPYCGPMRGTGSAISTVTVSTIRDVLSNSEKLAECEHLTPLSEPRAS